MRLIYTCPHCKAAINAKKNIILAASLVDQKENKGLALLHEEMGNYTVALSSTLKVDVGDVVDRLGRHAARDRLGYREDPPLGRLGERGLEVVEAHAIVEHDPARTGFGHPERLLAARRSV